MTWDAIRHSWVWWPTKVLVTLLIIAAIAWVYSSEEREAAALAICICLFFVGGIGLIVWMVFAMAFGI